MTSYKMPYVSPYPVQCKTCGEDLEEGDVVENVYFRNSHREIKLECTQCEQRTKVSQKPLLTDYQYIEE